MATGGGRSRKVGGTQAKDVCDPKGSSPAGPRVPRLRPGGESGEGGRGWRGARGWGARVPSVPLEAFPSGRLGKLTSCLQGVAVPTASVSGPALPPCAFQISLAGS